VPYAVIEKNRYGTFIAWFEKPPFNRTLILYEGYEGRSHYEWLWDIPAIKALIAASVAECRRAKGSSIDFPIRELLQPVLIFPIGGYSGPIPCGPVAFEREVRRLLPPYVSLIKEKLILGKSLKLIWSR